MPTLDPRVDAYIEKAPEFAQPILTHLRAVVHEACPDVVETIKWGMPAFEYHGILCGMAAFKNHATLGFWKHTLVVDDASGKDKDAMGSFGRLRSKADLPAKALLKRYVKKAMKLNEDGVKVTNPKHVRKQAPPMHPEFKAALGRNAKAKAAFEAFAPSHKREYLEWIVEAKKDETRTRRIEQALAWLAQGKKRNWKYESC